MREELAELRLHWQSAFNELQDKLTAWEKWKNKTVSQYLASLHELDKLEPKGTFNCPECGLGVPHIHDRNGFPHASQGEAMTPERIAELNTMLAVDPEDKTVESEILRECLTEIQRLQQIEADDKLAYEFLQDILERTEADLKSLSTPDKEPK